MKLVNIPGWYLNIVINSVYHYAFILLILRQILLQMHFLTKLTMVLLLLLCQHASVNRSEDTSHFVRRGVHCAANIIRH